MGKRDPIGQADGAGLGSLARQEGRVGAARVGQPEPRPVDDDSTARRAQRAGKRTLRIDSLAQEGAVSSTRGLGCWRVVAGLLRTSRKNVRNLCEPTPPGRRLIWHRDLGLGSWAISCEKD